MRDWDCDLVFGNGDVTHVIANATPLYDENGEPRGAVAAFIDVTERRNVEKALRESEERYRKLVELSPDAIFVNRQGKINLVNQAALDLFGAESAAQVLGKNPQISSIPPITIRSLHAPRHYFQEAESRLSK